MIRFYCSTVFLSCLGIIYRWEMLLSQNNLIYLNFKQVSPGDKTCKILHLDTYLFSYIRQEIHIHRFNMPKILKNALHFKNLTACILKKSLSKYAFF